MADRRISDLPSLSTANDSMQFIVNDGGTSRRISHLNFKNSETASSLLAKIKTVDGVGSGLDADTLQSTAPADLSLDGGYF
jgi:hypothetical protein